MPRAPELVEDDLDRLPGPGDGDMFVPKVASDVAEVLNAGPRAAALARAARSCPPPATYVPAGVEDCITTLAPLLMAVVCRTKNLSVRCGALLALSRMAYDAASARWVVLHRDVVALPRPFAWHCSGHHVACVCLGLSAECARSCCLAGHVS